MITTSTIKSDLVRRFISWIFFLGVMFFSFYIKKLINTFCGTNKTNFCWFKRRSNKSDQISKFFTVKDNTERTLRALLLDFQMQNRTFITHGPGQIWVLILIIQCLTNIITQELTTYFLIICSHDTFRFKTKLGICFLLVLLESIIFRF